MAGGDAEERTRKSDPIASLRDLAQLRERRRRAVLLIEDDPVIAESVTEMLCADEWSADRRDLLGHAQAWERIWAATAAAAAEALARRAFDLLIVDRNLPDGDGLDFIAALQGRYARLPVLMLTSMGEAAHSIEGLKRGADDYVAKPFDALHLLARIGAVSRRRDKEGLLIVGGLEINFIESHAIYRGRKVRSAGPKGLSGDLNPLELGVLAYLALRAWEAPDDADSAVATREMLLRDVWRYRVDRASGHVVNPESNVVEATIARLRKSLRENGLPEIVIGVANQGEPDVRTGRVSDLTRAWRFTPAALLAEAESQ